MMNRALEQLDIARQRASQSIHPLAKSELGQYMTPSRIADFMASLFTTKGIREARILDAGAGIGSLSIALFERLNAERSAKNVSWVGYEIDPELSINLRDYIQNYAREFASNEISFSSELRQTDFVEDAVKRIVLQREIEFNLAILNPPYKKINSQSRHRLLLRELKIETVNLYTAFLALVVDLLADGGQVVAIVPRSFCNGPYYRSFRRRILAKTAITHIHLFAARDRAFRDEDVLQENIIVRLERGKKQGPVTVSMSTDGDFKDYHERALPFEEIVAPGDEEQFIHIPLPGKRTEISLKRAFHFSLGELGLEVSTGPVVDFRVKRYMRAEPEQNTVPLIYPGHFGDGTVDWPKLGSKKPNALVLCDETEKWLYPTGFYVVVRRFSSKEERRRVVANIINPNDFASYRKLGFENHLNVFHAGKRGLPEEAAYGLATYLNSTFIDQVFRDFSGHTQVNATDLRLLKYPAMKSLISLGVWARRQTRLTQQNIDEKVHEHGK